MKKYISILLAAVLSVSLLAGCGGSDNSGKKPAEETQEQTAQPEGTEQAQPSEDAAQADAAQADAAKDEAQAADNTANSGAYVVCVIDAETMSAGWARRMRTVWLSSKLTPEHILSI